MEWITTKEAASRFKKSVSTIKRVVSNAPDSKLKYEPSRTALNRRLFISFEYLEVHFGSVRDTAKRGSFDTENDTVLILKEQVKSQKETIDKLLHNQEQLIENERNFQILLERASKRAELLEQHFERNKKINVEQKEQEEIIEEIIEEPIESDNKIYLPNDRASFNEWLESFNNAK